MTTTTQSRRALHAYLSHEAHEQWHDFAAHNGVSVSAMLEAMAPELTAPATDHSGVPLAKVIKSARLTDSRRRRRRP